MENCGKTSYIPENHVHPIFRNINYLSFDSSRIGSVAGGSGDIRLFGHKFIIVKAKNQLGEPGEDDEKIFEYEAVCLCCSNGFNADNVLKTKCKCKKFALIHDGCQSGKDCSNCKQPFEYVPVILVSEDSHPTSPDGKVIRESRARMLFNKLPCVVRLLLALKKESEE